MKKMKTLTPPLALLLKLWPGLIALVSLLALWGEGVQHPERSARMLLSAGQTALPELRAVPAPTPGPGLVGSPDAPPRAALVMVDRGTSVVLGQAQQGAPYPDLRLLGRDQTDGA
jgi:hypothetical protein